MHKLSQKIIITPQLKQALRLLQLPHSTLVSYIEQEISENPLLEPIGQKELESKIKALLTASRTEYLPGNTSLGSDNKQQRLIENIKAKEAGIYEYLLHQLRMAFLNEVELSIAQELISHIDSNGYLRLSHEHFAKTHNITMEQFQKILGAVQSLEPAGIGARNLRECLLLQLKDKEKEGTLPYKMVNLYLRETAKKAYADIADKLNVPLSEVEKAAKEIASLNPKPAAGISRQEKNFTITPDIKVFPRDGKLQIVFNNTGFPELKINSNYRRLLMNPDIPPEAKQFIRDRLKRALWLINAINRRNVNNAKIMRAIINIQRNALLKGFIHLKPLSLREISQKTNLHISTAGRIVADKYIDSPQGILRVRDLLSAKIKSPGRKTIAGKSLPVYLKQLIAEEGRPLSDQKIATILKQRDICVSRRTITKYRNRLKISPSFLR